MTGGTFNKDGNALRIGSGGGIAQFDQSGGTINSSSEYWLAENSGTIGTNNISGTATLNLSNWVSIARGGQATVNFSGGTINNSGGNFIVGDGGNGYFNQTAGTLNISGEFGSLNRGLGLVALT